MTLRRPQGLFVASLALGLAAPTAFAQAPGGPPPPPPIPSSTPKGPAPPGVAAVVNGEKITTKTVDALTDVRLPLVIANAKKQLQVQAVNGLIAQTLLDQESKKQGVSAPTSEINTRLAEIKKQIASDPRNQGRSFDALLKDSGETQADFISNLRLRILAEKLITKATPPTVMVHARHILVLTNNPNNDPTLKVHTDAEAKEIIAKAQGELKSGKSFNDVAKKYSEDPSNKDKGGDLGVIGTSTAFDPAFLQAALALKKGQVTPEPVKSAYGYHLIKVDSTNADATGDEKVAYTAAMKAIKDQQTSPQAIQTYVQSLFNKAKIVNYLAP